MKKRDSTPPRRDRRSRRIPAAVAFTAAAIVASLAWWLSSVRSDVVAPARTAATRPSTYKVFTPFAEARTILDRLPAAGPAELRSAAPAGAASAWGEWAARHDTEIRARLDRGDEDSVVNFWLYGTSFTRLPRATQTGMDALGSDDAFGRVLAGRLDDLLAGASAAGTNQRLQFVRQVLARHGIDPATPDGRARAFDYLDDVRTRMAAEEQSYRQAIQSAQGSGVDRERSVYARLYDDRGLSSDTGMAVGFGLERTLAALAAGGQAPAHSIRRVAIVGPGLDFTDKAEGYDFYPPQTIQPFALVDSLRRLNLGAAELAITTLDISARVTGHLEQARAHAAAGERYVLHLPLDRDTAQRQWHPALIESWRQFGDRIGDVVAGAPLPAGLQHVQVRAVAVRPEVVRAVTPRDLNVIVERLGPLPADQRFDLVVATNILVYYDAFEQALALANISSMLRPGGLLITSDAVAPVSPMDTSPAQVVTVERDRQGTTDALFAYQRH